MTVKFDFKTLDTGFAADWPVKVSVPVDGGAVETQTFMAQFRTPRPDERTELDAMTDINARLKRSLEIGFVGLGQGEETNLTAAALLAKLWSAPNVQLALIRAYGEFQAGIAAKN